MEVTYIQDDSLKAHIDWDAILPMSRYAGGHDEQMQGLIRGATVLSHWNEGDYSGSVATAIRLPDGRCAIYNDYYGSCSGCDSWDDATDADVRKMCEDLANGAYVFATPEDALLWIADVADGTIKADGYSWTPEVAAGLRDKWGVSLK